MSLPPSRNPRRRRTRRHVLLTSLVSFFALLPFVTVPTIAAWSDSAHFRAPVSAAAQFPVATGCKVMSSTGTDTGKSCAINLAASSAAEFGDGKGPGERTANVYLGFTFAAPGSGEYVLFTVDLRTVPGFPANWVWDSPMRGFSLGSLIAQPGSSCSALPFLTARAPSWASGNTVHFTYYENRTGKSGLGCA